MFRGIIPADAYYSLSIDKPDELLDSRSNASVLSNCGTTRDQENHQPSMSDNDISHEMDKLRLSDANPSKTEVMTLASMSNINSIPKVDAECSELAYDHSPTSEASTPTSTQDGNCNLGENAELNVVGPMPERLTTFTSLPVEVLRRIFDFLLTARHVREDVLFSESSETKRFRTTSYEFQLSILSVNKTISALALDVFHENHFFLVTSKHMSLKRLIESSDIQIWSSNITDFKHYRLHALLDFTAASVNDKACGKKRCSFLICQDDLPYFASAIELNNLNRRIGIKAVFQLNPKDSKIGMPPKTQRELLAPFKVLQGLREALLFDKRTDTSLLEELRTHMTHHAHWHRAHARRLFGVIAESKIAADEAFILRSFELAARRYRNLLVVVQDAVNHNIQVLRKDDEVFWHNYHQLVLAVQYNYAASLVWSGMALMNSGTVEQGNACLRHVFSISLDRNLDFNLKPGRHMYSGLLCCHIMACLALHDAKQLPLLLDRAKSFRMDAVFHSALDVLIKDVRKACADIEKTSEAVLKFTRVLPREPAGCELQQGRSISATIDQERYMLKALGYRGDLLEQEIVQKQGYCVLKQQEIPHAFDPAISDDLVRELKEMVRQQSGRQDMPIVYLGSMYK